MIDTCERAVRSLRVCAWLNIKQAKQHRQNGRQRMAGYHLSVAIECRRDANSLRSTSTHSSK